MPHLKFRSDSKLAPHAAEIARLYSAGESTISLGKRYGVNSTTVLRFLRKLGTPLRNHSTAALLAIETGRHKVLAGPDVGTWKGGRIPDGRGYMLLRMPGHHLANVHGYVAEHRLIAEQKIGRRLMQGEVVHHCNGDVADNRPENLLVLTKAQHSALHVKQGDMGGLALGPYARGRHVYQLTGANDV